MLKVKVQKTNCFQKICVKQLLPPSDEYAYLMGKKLCFESARPFNNFMRTMSDVYQVKGADGLLLWFSNSEKSKHIANMVQRQKTPREFQIRHSPLKRKGFYNSTSTCFYNDNYMYKNQR